MKTGRFAATVGAICLSGLVLAANPAVAATVTINPVKDNTIYDGVDPGTGEDFTLNSCGAGTNVFIGNTADGFARRALLQFDIAGNVAAGSTINSVTLTMDVNRSGDNQDAPASLHSVSTDWGEGIVNCDAARGGGTGLPASVGDATWLDAMFQQVPWRTAGGDFGAASAQVSGALCGNGLCEAGDGENCVTCPADCAGKQNGSASKQFCCGFDDGQVTNPIGCDIGAADNRCIDASVNLFCREAPRVSACCGDALCEGAETETSCAVDCAAESPPPQDCTYADPSVSISPNTQDIATDGGSVRYTVTVANNDTAACPDTTFSLSVSDTNGTDFVIPSTLGQDAVLLAPAASTEVTLTVTGQAGAPNGATNDSSVATAADANHGAVTSNTVTTTINVVGQVDCSQFTTRNDCRNEPTGSCRWDNRNAVCVNR